MMLRVRSHSVVTSPLGEVTLVAEDGALTRVAMEGPGHGPVSGELGRRDDGALAEAARQLREYFARERTSFDLLLAPAGDDFNQRVWGLLREIPYGETRSYGQLARALGDVNLSQAVGVANGRN